MPKRLSLEFIHWTNIYCLGHCHLYTSISFSTWLPLYLSLFLCPLYSPSFRSHSPAIRCKLRYQQNIFFSTKPVTCGQRSISWRSVAPNVSLMCSLDPACGLYPQYGLILFYYESFHYFPPRTRRSLKEIFLSVFPIEILHTFLNFPTVFLTVLGLIV
jgi:hypothetical protein